MHPKVALQVKEEIDKLHTAKFIREMVYPQWVANIVPVRKKDGKDRVCIDFCDLNKACLKDDFALPHINLINNTVEYEMLSFMDEYSSYNQIKLVKADLLPGALIVTSSCHWGLRMLGPLTNVR